MIFLETERVGSTLGETGNHGRMENANGNWRNQDASRIRWHDEWP